MIIVMRHGASDKNIENVVKYIESKKRVAHISKGESHTIIGGIFFAAGMTALATSAEDPIAPARILNYVYL